MYVYMCVWLSVCPHYQKSIDTGRAVCMGTLISPTEDWLQLDELCTNFKCCYHPTHTHTRTPHTLPFSLCPSHLCFTPKKYTHTRDCLPSCLSAKSFEHNLIPFFDSLKLPTLAAAHSAQEIKREHTKFCAHWALCTQISNVCELLSRNRQTKSAYTHTHTYTYTHTM